jgi:hypothetical protein
MKAEVINRHYLKEIPSASGIEIIGELIYIISDDSPFLFVLDKTFKIFRRISLFDYVTGTDGKIPKLKKPDLESLTTVSIGRKKYLLAVGSGSFERKRDAGFLIDLKNDEVRKISFSPFFNQLTKYLRKNSGGELNIEGSVFSNRILHFFQRGNVAGKNMVFSVQWKELQEAQEDISFKVHEFDLPLLLKVRAGFSGACLIPGSQEIVFTASVEQTPNVIDDGAIAGSFAGVISPDLSDRKIITSRITRNGKIYRRKVESIAVINKISQGEMICVAVCDQDAAYSELLELKISL